MYSYTRFCAEYAQLALKVFGCVESFVNTFPSNCQKQAWKMVYQNQAMLCII